jgi:DNA replication protein DnaC
VPLDQAESKLLFQVVSYCCEQGSVIITTNLEFSKWVNVFCDEQMTAAMIDRLIHHSYLLLFDGQSYRIKNSLMSVFGIIEMQRTAAKMSQGKSKTKKA